MIRNASLFLALRYLKPKRSFVTVITFLSVLGPILGVSVLIVVISVMAGFNRDIRDKILGMQAHIQLRSRFNTTIDSATEIVDELKNHKITASPVVEGPILIQTKRRVRAKLAKGIDPNHEIFVTDIHDHITAGKFTVENNEVLIGNDLALQCNLHIGDSFLIHAPDKLTRMFTFAESGNIDEKSSSVVYMPEEVVVAGIFSLGVYEFDSSFVVMHFDTANDLFGLEWESATSVQIRTGDPFDLDPVVEFVSNNPIFSDLVPVTWQQSNQRLFGALKVEKNLMFFVLIFIMIVAAFGISATLITVVIEKTREIGVLKSLGATQMTILSIFVLQGTIVGAIGISVGTILGLVVIRFRNGIANIIGKIMGTEIFPKDLYHLSQIPALVQPLDVFNIILSALIICILGALIPALIAAAMSPADALRNEI